MQRALGILCIGICLAAAIVLTQFINPFDGALRILFAALLGAIGAVTGRLIAVKLGFFPSHTSGDD